MSFLVTPKARRRLLERRDAVPPRDAHGDTVKGWLRELGAPLAEGHAETPQRHDRSLR